MTTATKSKGKGKDDAGADAAAEAARAEARQRLTDTGRNDPCACGSGKKYKKCHLAADQAAAAPPAEVPSAKSKLESAWRLFEQRRPGAAEREFRAALELDGSLLDARVGIGMARLSSGDADGAKGELQAVMEAGETDAAKWRDDKVTDAFTRPEAQPYLRAAHALGCLAYDQERWSDAVSALERVFSVDGGSVGSEARLIAAKALMKEQKAAEAVKVLEPAATAEASAARGKLGLALAHFTLGAEAEARTALAGALAQNPHFGKALQGRIRRRVEAVAGTQPGSVEEALLYSQTYGDVWTPEAKAFVGKVEQEQEQAKETEREARRNQPAPEQQTETAP
jgi:tetratricopeptide (TPR) repeat protein